MAHPAGRARRMAEAALAFDRGRGVAQAAADGRREGVALGPERRWLTGGKAWAMLPPFSGARPPAAR